MIRISVNLGVKGGMVKILVVEGRKNRLQSLFTGFSEKWDLQVKELHDTSGKSVSIEECDKMIHTMNLNEQIVERLKKLIEDVYPASTMIPKLELQKILEGKI